MPKPIQLSPITLASLVLMSVASMQGAASAAALPAANSTAQHQSDGIAWRKGDVEDALAEAKDSGKPVLLYWGAVWCPPCNQLKATLFKEPDFIALTRNYVTVYLDGDSPGAQAWGERFGVRGYPTLVLLGPDRQELTRLSGGGDPARITNALRSASARKSSVTEVLSTALRTPEKLNAEDWALLSQYGWEVDANRLSAAGQQGQLFQDLAKRAPNGPVQRRFELLALADGAQTHTERKKVLDPVAARALLQAILHSPEEVRSNAEVLSYAGASLVDLASADAASFDALGAELTAALEKSQSARVGNDPLAVVQVEVALYRVHHAKDALPAALLQRVKAKVAAADAAARTPYERQATISSAADLLDQAGDAADSENLLLAELDKSPTPYYYMGDLAELAEKRGDTRAALEWLRRGYAASEGPATRVQWGVLYVEGLLRMSPADVPTIERVAGQVIDELSADSAGYHQRTQQRFERMERALSQWSSKHDGTNTLSRLQSRLTDRCDKATPVGGADRAACVNWTNS